MSNDDQIQELWKAHHKSKAELIERISELEGEQRETDAIVRGPDGTNGLRSRVVTLEKISAENTGDINDMRSEIRHYIDAEREKTCHGKLALKEHELKHEEKDRGGSEVKIAKGNNMAMMATQLIQIAGLIAVALIGLQK